MIDTLATENSLLVYLTDTSGKIIYSTDAYKTNYAQENNYSYQNDGANPYFQNEEMNWQKAAYRHLPDDYDYFLAKLKNSGHMIEYQTENIYVYGQYVKEDMILYVSSI